MRRKRSRGQGLVEFALALPLLLLVLLIALDGGRLFYGYISLHNATRIAANYAAIHPDDWPAGTASGNPAEYDAQVTRDTANLDCDPNIFSPTFTPAAKPHGAGSGHVATVSLTCVFHPLTPIISGIIGNGITLRSTDVFPIRAGILAGIPISPALPPIPSASASTQPSPSSSASPSGSPGPSASPTLPPGQCLVPTLLGVATGKVVTDWQASGFNLNKLNVTVGPPDYPIRAEWQVKGQSIINDTWDGTQQSCGSFTLNVGP